MLQLLTKGFYYQHRQFFREAKFQIHNFGSIFNHEEMRCNFQVRRIYLTWLRIGVKTSP
jgi:hypothetical protein